MITALSIAVEFAASFIEIFILYDIFQLLLSNNKKISKSKASLAVIVGALLLVQGLNAISLFSAATIIVMVLYWSITAKLLYKTAYTTALSVTGIYVISTIVYDFFFFSAVGSMWGGYETFMSIIEMGGQSRMFVVFAAKLLWAVCYIFLRRYLVNAEFKSESTNFFLKISVTGCIACLILAKITFDSFPETINQYWLILLFALVSLLFYHSFSMNTKFHKAQVEMVDMRNRLLENNYKELNEIYT